MGPTEMTKRTNFWTRNSFWGCKLTLRQRDVYFSIQHFNQTRIYFAGIGGIISSIISWRISLIGPSIRGMIHPLTVSAIAPTSLPRIQSRGPRPTIRILINLKTGHDQLTADADINVTNICNFKPGQLQSRALVQGHGSLGSYVYTR